MMRKIWDDEAWADYLAWQGEDRKKLKKINSLLKDIESNGCLDGIGKPEPLKDNWQGWFSRRIDEKNRLIYRINGKFLEIAQCKNHYDDK